jgi:hypothetical protein
MWFKLIGIVSVALIFIIDGIICYRRSLSSDVQYDFKEDFKHSFLTLHRRHSSHHNYDKSRPRRIVPVMFIVGGIGFLIVGLIKIL